MRVIIGICAAFAFLIVCAGGWFLYRQFSQHKQQQQGSAPALIGDTGKTPYDPIPDYQQQCSNGNNDSLDCAWLRSLVVAQTVEALETIEYSRDQRGVAEALEALQLQDQPEIQIAAGRVLGVFPYDSNTVAQVIPLLFSPYVEVERIGAQLLSRSSDAAIAALGHQWAENHNNVRGNTPYRELPMAAGFSEMGFPEYPGAVHFPPADSDRSVGWLTTDDAAAVERNITERLSVQPLSYEEWYNHTQLTFRNTTMPAYNQTAIAEYQKLMEQYMKNPDPKLLQQMEKLQKQISEPMEKGIAVTEKSVDRVSFPPTGVLAQGARYWIAEERNGRVSKLVVAYPQPALGKTVIQMAWDLNDYKPAWN